jgi:FtsH-binding integral membrane protein
MSDFDRVSTRFGRASVGTSAVVDPGLRAYMLHIYNYMVLGLAITGCAALGTYMLAVTNDPSAVAFRLRDGLALTSFGHAVFVGPLKWAIIFAPLVLVFVLSFGIERMRPATAQLLFWIYAALVGMSLAAIFLVYTHTSIVRVFFITAASFGALSVWGYTTQRDLTGIGSFLIMGLFGVIIASLVNVFLGSSSLQFVISVVGVLVFAGLTAWDTQRIKEITLRAILATC